MASSQYAPTPPVACTMVTEKFAENGTLTINSQHYNYYGDSKTTDWYGFVKLTETGGTRFFNSHPSTYIRILNFADLYELFNKISVSEHMQMTYFRKFTNYATYEIVYACISVDGTYTGSTYKYTVYIISMCIVDPKRSIILHCNYLLVYRIFGYYVISGTNVT